MIESRRPRRKQRPLLRLGLLATALVVVFALGVALGQALEEGPGTGGTVTRVRTLHPLPIAPARETVTVTASR